MSGRAYLELVGATVALVLVAVGTASGWALRPAEVRKVVVPEPPPANAYIADVAETRIRADAFDDGMNLWRIQVNLVKPVTPERRDVYVTLVFGGAQRPRPAMLFRAVVEKTWHVTQWCPYGGRCRAAA